MSDFFEHASLWSAVATVLSNDYYFDYAAALRVTVECHLALKCKASVDDPMSLSLPPIIDQAWHFAILNTALYRQYCEQALGGKFLDHTTVTVNDDVAVKNERVAATILKYVDLFHRKPPVDLWQLEGRRAGPTVTKQVVLLDEPVVATRVKQEEEEEEEEHESIVVAEKKKKNKKRPRETADIIETITVFVKSINGDTVAIYNIDPRVWTVDDIKVNVEAQTDIPSDGARLIFAGRHLDNDKTLHDYNIRNNSTFHIVRNMRGC